MKSLNFTKTICQIVSVVMTTLTFSFSFADDQAPKCDNLVGEFGGEATYYGDELAPGVSVTFLHCYNFRVNPSGDRMAYFKVKGFRGIENGKETDLIRDGYQSKQEGNGYRLSKDDDRKVFMFSEQPHWNGRYLGDANVRYEDKVRPSDNVFLDLRTQTSLKPGDPDYHCTQSSTGSKLSLTLKSLNNKTLKIDGLICTSRMNMGGTRTAIVTLSLKDATNKNIFKLEYDDKQMQWLDTHHDENDAYTFNVKASNGSTYDFDSSALMLTNAAGRSEIYFWETKYLDSAKKAFSKLSRATFSSVSEKKKTDLGSVEMVPFVVILQEIAESQYAKEVRVLDPKKVKNLDLYLKQDLKFRGSPAERIKQYLFGSVVLSKNMRQPKGPFPDKPAGMLLYQLEPQAVISRSLLGSIQDNVDRALNINPAPMSIKQDTSFSWPSLVQFFPNGATQEADLSEMRKEFQDFFPFRQLMKEDVELLP